MAFDKDKEEIDRKLALSQQIKYLADAFERFRTFVQGPANEPYGVPGPSRIGSQEEPIIISDEDIKIKKEKDDNVAASEKVKKAARKKFTNKGNSTENPVSNKNIKKTSRAKEKAPIRSSSSDGSSSPGSAKKTSRTKEKAPVCSSSSDGSSSSDSSSSSDGSSSSSSSSYGSNNHYYFKKDDMPKELREALRKEVIRQYDALPEKKRIDLRRTFAKQRKRVNNDIIPSIMKTINRDKFPISNEITYDIVHSLHRHRREEFLKKSRSSAERKFQRKRKHNNSRRHDKRRKRAKMINHLQLTENSLIKKFKPKDLQLLIDHSVYHSPEDSETDLESEKSIIVVKDLKWRSSTLRSFLRDYIDRLRAEGTNSRKLRERIISNNFSNDTLAPLLAPRWTRAGYSGRLRDEVIKACYKQHHEETTESQYTNPNYETSLNDNAYAAPKQGLGDLDSNDTPPDKPRNQIENQRNDQNQPDSRTYNDGYDADVGEEEEEEEVLLTSNDQPVNQNTDDDNLEMDD